MRDESSGAAGQRGSRYAGMLPEGSGMSDTLSKIAAMFRKIAGMPDYAAHVEHLRQHHPDTPIPTRREFYEKFLECRYQEGPTRCC